MKQTRLWVVLALALGVISAEAQQTIYWKKDHIYNGPGGKEIATVTPAPSDQTLPTAPSGLSYSSVTSTSVQLNWTASSDTGGSGLAGYKIYRGSVPVGTVGAGTLSFQDPHLKASSTHTYTIRAFDNAQNHSAPSNSVTFSTTADGSAPTVPAEPRLTYVGNTTARFEWKASTDSGDAGLAGYRVYRDGVLISGANPSPATAWTDATLAVNTGYSYTVLATDYAGNNSSPTSARSLFRDDFNRSNSTGLNNSSWATSASWNVASNQASMSVNNGAWQDALSSKSFGGFTASVRVGNLGPGYTAGFFFWGDSGAPHYRAHVSNGTLYLDHRDGQGNLDSAQMTFFLGTMAACTLRVEADSATRTIKVFYDGVLKITWTDPNSAHPTTGKVGITSSIAPNTSGTVTVDDFIVEETNGFPSSSDASAPSVPSNPSVGYTNTATSQVEWTASTDSGGSGLAGYQVYRNGTLISGTAPSPHTYFHDANLAVNTAYSYTIKAVDNAGNTSAASTAVSIFRDNFNRNDSSGLGTADWSESGLFNLTGNRVVLTPGNGSWTDALSAKSFGTFRASVLIESLPVSSNGGMTFWADGADRYRVAFYASTLSLAYYTASGGIGLVSATASVPGTLRIEANATTRVIKIYVNDVLKINYTETNTSRRNSGKVGLNGAIPNGVYTSLLMDDFVVEER
jgi:chitodextrinase